MIAQGRGGKIINLSSLVARSPLFGAPTHYAAANGGIEAFTRVLADELGPYNINVNAVAPGTTVTERVRQVRRPEELQVLAQKTPLGRLSDPEDIASVIVFLASEAARHITGACLAVNGGITMI
jgi:NAD(P)-dependent dehydrogenase (short-subunit alcohol dehydrogenase family)